MRGALYAHDEVPRTAIEKHGGYLFQPYGDGVVAAFAARRFGSISDREALVNPGVRKGV